MKNTKLIPLTKLLIQRLERLSPDSSWSHQASGIRRDLIRFLEMTGRKGTEQAFQEEMDVQRLRNLIARSLELLEKAARELRG